MSDTLDFTPAEPLPPSEGIYDSLPEDVVKNVLERSGFKDSEEVTGPPSGLEEQEVTEEPLDAPLPPEAPGDEVEVEPEDPEGSVRLPDGRLLPLALITEWADAQARPTLPPLPSPPVATQSQPLPPSGPPPFQLPPITQEDLEMAGPVARALLMVANAQAQQLREVREQQATISSQVASRQKRENAELANSAATSFQRQYNLPDELMGKIKESVQQSDIEAYLYRKPDAYEAVEYALKRAYNDNPEARQYEFERMSQARNAATTRKRKLAGVNGSGGSGPRGTPAIDESTPEGMKQAAIELARAAMYGDTQ